MVISTEAVRQYRFAGHSILLPDPPDHGPALSMQDEVEVRERHWLLHPNEVVVDVGAGFGSYTLTAACQGAKVLAFEPVKHERKLLLEAVALNQRWGSWGAVLVEHRALYDTSGCYPEALLKQIHPCPPELLNPANFTTLDHWVGRLDPGLKVSAIKIDTEGGELGILRGAVRTLAWHPKLVIEDHSSIYEWCRQTDYAGQIRKLLSDLGYEILEVPYHTRTILVAT